MSQLDHLLDNNRAWAQSIHTSDPQFFEKLAAQQSPEYLWIGCSDSRVPANQIVGLMPGEVFVHRNVANLVVHTDFNCMSVIEFSVKVLKVKHIIVCGHYGCGGVKASIDNTSHGLIDNWLANIKDVQRRYNDELAALPDDDARIDRLVELNVRSQVEHVCQTTIVQNAWARGQRLEVHGWVYSLRDGLLRDLGCSVDSAEGVDRVYRFAT